MKITSQNINDVFKSKRCSSETLELKGYELIEEFFVDASGCGTENEPALKVDKFLSRLSDLLIKEGSVYSFITNAGQFQVYVGIFKRTGKKRCKMIARNTLEVLHDNGDRSIRFHDTDIIIYKSNGDIVLSSGGWYTVTTKQRLNMFLPSEVVIYQKSFTWYVKQGDKTREFSDGMIL